MTDDALGSYLGAVEPRFAPMVRTLDAAVRAAGEALDVRHTYGMLLYTRGARWRRWVCGISTTRKGVQLRFLFGTRMPDPRGILRGGTSTLMTIDYATPDDIDPAVATAYVRDALAVHDQGDG